MGASCEARALVKHDCPAVPLYFAFTVQLPEPFVSPQPVSQSAEVLLLPSVHVMFCPLFGVQVPSSFPVESS
jgi:hypothetical protein